MFQKQVFDDMRKSDFRALYGKDLEHEILGRLWYAAGMTVNAEWLVFKISVTFLEAIPVDGKVLLSATLC